MLALFAAAIAASTPAPATPSDLVLESAVPWFERITVTLDDKGAQKSCKYQFSLSQTGAEDCDKDMAASVGPKQAKGQDGVYSKLTFERRFSPGTKLDTGKLPTGDKLLSQQVLFLTIDAKGEIGSCKVLATSGDLLPAYDCDQAKTEQFKVAASAPAGTQSEAFMTVTVYGHQEQIA
ncbi:hypothetical protein [Sphingomonas alba]|uniref:Uncharacterized protein n=1 Tax=Sphingomonas alba TaxID=2908208 RepID=A0ABT0RKG8_9SPHN|nr:hypothetical protein [Sphingomonas alba]MCL6683147.1 hypothetical protein [Sphingomonas alba]